MTTAPRKLSLSERLKPIQDRLMSYPPTGLEADKAFYDWLCGESDDELADWRKR